MRFIAIATALIALLTLGSCSKKGETEKETNNSFSTANEILPDSRFLGSMGSANDRDFFKLAVGQGGVLDIQLSGVKGINVAFKVWKGDEEPELLKWVDDNRKSSSERLPNLSVVPGVYYIEIFQSDRDPKKADRENPYEFISKRRDAISEESEPNDRRVDADTVYPDREITGYFSPAYNRLNNDKENLHREEDWFVADVGLKSDAPMLMDITLSGVMDVNSLICLYDSESNLIASSDNVGTGEPESITGAGIRKSGSYYIQVASKGYAANHDEPYALKIILKEHDSGTEIEPNNEFGAANPYTDTVITGKINSKEDTDIFLYQVNEGPAMYRIELRPPEDMDAVLSLYNAEKEKIIDINGGGKGKKEIYPDFHSAKDFYMAVTARSGEKQSAGEYMLTATPLKDAGAMEQEPNNDTSRANRMSGESVTGFTSYRGDKDCFLLISDSRVKEKFEVRGAKGGGISVSITDPLGYIIRTVDVQGDRTVMFSEMIDRKGYIIIEAVKENYDNPYIINLRGAQ